MPQDVQAFSECAVLQELGHLAARCPWIINSVFMDSSTAASERTAIGFTPVDKAGIPVYVSKCVFLPFGESQLLGVEHL